jgi:hypothetical protein
MSTFPYARPEGRRGAWPDAGDAFRPLETMSR